MAFATTTIFDMQNGGSDTANGGGFDAGNANFATDASFTAANTASPVVTSASYTFVAGDVGHWFYYKLGTGSIPGWYQIASVSGGAATLSAAAGAGYLMGSNVPVGPTTALGCATTASPTGGTWGIDYSRSTTPAISYTDLVIGATTTQFTSVANPVGKNLVGNMMAVTNGTGFTVQTIQIVSTSTITATCDKSLGTTASTGGTGGLGGSIATIGQASKLVNSAVDNGCTVFFKYNATPTTAGSTANAAGGRWASGNNANLIGWNTTRTIGNQDTLRPTIQCSANSMTVISSGCYQYVMNLILDANSHTACTGFNIGNPTTLVRCKAMGFSTGFNVSGSVSTYDRCEATSCTTYGWIADAAATYLRCSCVSCSTGFFAEVGVANYRDCTATGSTTVGFLIQTNGSSADHCTVQGATAGAGFDLGTFSVNLSNCLAYNNSTFGFKQASSSLGQRLFNCAGGANTTANYSTTFWPMQVENFVVLTADPFTAKGASPPDLSLNSTAGGGAACKGAGVSTSPVGLAGTSSPDIGAYQSGASAAGVIGSRLFTGF